MCSACAVLSCQGMCTVVGLVHQASTGVCQGARQRGNTEYRQHRVNQAWGDSPIRVSLYIWPPAVQDILAV